MNAQWQLKKRLILSRQGGVAVDPARFDAVNFPVGRQGWLIDSLLAIFERSLDLQFSRGYPWSGIRAQSQHACS